MSYYALVICFSAVRSLLMSWNTVRYKGLELSLISLGGYTKKLTFKCFRIVQTVFAFSAHVCTYFNKSLHLFLIILALYEDIRNG